MLREKSGLEHEKEGLQEQQAVLQQKSDWLQQEKDTLSACFEKLRQEKVALQYEQESLIKENITRSKEARDAKESLRQAQQGWDNEAARHANEIATLRAAIKEISVAMGMLVDERLTGQAIASEVRMDMDACDLHATTMAAALTRAHLDYAWARTTAEHVIASVL